MPKPCVKFRLQRAKSLPERDSRAIFTAIWPPCLNGRALLTRLRGSVTQIPILTMPNDDITHPIPDLTGYITEGQIALDRGLNLKGIYPPVAILPSLSRLMKDGIGEGFTGEDHPDLSNQLFASYAKVQEVRSLASVIGEDELSAIDKEYLKFGNAFEIQFLNQGKNENGAIPATLSLGWQLFGTSPQRGTGQSEPRDSGKVLSQKRVNFLKAGKIDGYYIVSHKRKPHAGAGLL